MEAELRALLAARLLAIADDELILGHRNSEWCGQVGVLDENMAFANIALDEITHATLWLSLVAGLLGEDQEKYPLWLMYGRDAAAFRCARFVELPRQDWAFTVVRQYLFDVAEQAYLSRLVSSPYAPVSAMVGRMQRDEAQHVRLSGMWLRRLALGSTRTKRHLQQALKTIWPFTGQLFAPIPGEERLVERGYSVDFSLLRPEWFATIAAGLHGMGLEIPDPAEPASGPGRDVHTDDLRPLLSVIQAGLN